MKLKTHLIITDIHEEFHIKWCGRIIDTKPLIKNKKPVFVVVGGAGRIELNTTSMNDVEYWGKRMTYPLGRESFTTDKSYIYIKEENGNEKLLGIITHNHIKQYAQMFDEVAE